MDISVIICTHNRSASLRDTLNGLCSLRPPQPIAWELVLVDNASTDETRRVVSEFEKALPIRYVSEPQLGVARATNRGVREATGELLVFTDDDVDLDDDWLASYWDAAQRHPGIEFFGGKILPRWEATPPNWVAENLGQLWHITRVDQGDSELDWEKIPDATFCGANMAYRRRLFDAGFRFNEDYGIKGSERAAGHEGELQRRLVQDGHRGLYLPGAVVYHRIPTNRLTERYLRQFHKGYGISRVRFGRTSIIDGSAGALWFGIPRWYWKKFFGTCLRYVARRWTRPSRQWLEAEIDMATMWGVICETRRRQTPRPRSEPSRSS